MGGKSTLVGLIDEFDQKFGQGVGLVLGLLDVLKCLMGVPFCRWV